jgi:predicted amidohydrolase
MITYVVFNLETEEIEKNCAICGIYGGDIATYDKLQLPHDHGKMLLTPSERDKAMEFDPEAGEYTHRVNWVEMKLLRK